MVRVRVLFTAINVADTVTRRISFVAQGEMVLLVSGQKYTDVSMEEFKEFVYEMRQSALQ